MLHVDWGKLRGPAGELLLNPAERHVHLLFHLDSNRINARGTLSAINQLERWRADDVIELELSEVAHDEVARAGSAHRQKAREYLHTETLADTQDEQWDVARIASILFPGGARSAADRNDVLIVFNARKYGAILITNDGASTRQPRGILGSASDLKAIDARVMTEDEAVALVREHILRRDERARRKHEEYGMPLPDWIGCD